MRPAVPQVRPPKWDEDNGDHKRLFARSLAHRHRSVSKVHPELRAISPASAALPLVSTHQK